MTIAGGLGRIPELLAAEPRIQVQRSAPVTALRPTPQGGSRVIGDAGVLTHADAVVLAVPSAVAARLIGPLDASSGRALDPIESATVATVVTGYPRAEIATHEVFRANGLLIPSATGRAPKSATFLCRKWPHLASHELFLVRMSAGRAGADHLDALSDDDLVDRLHDDLAELTGLRSPPRQAVVRRWPATMPQLHVGHREVTASVRERLVARHRITLAGAAYDGVGIGSCLRSARAAVTRLSADPGTEEHVA